MSICVLVKVGEGLVLATDSASSVIGSPITADGDQGPQGIIKIFFTGSKLLQLGELPVGIMTWGAGGFGNRTIASIVEEFESEDYVRKLERKNLDIEELARKLWDFLFAASETHFPGVPVDGRPKSGIVIGGYTKDHFFPDEYSMQVPTMKPYKPRPSEDGKPNFGANWYGMTDAIVRFHHGRDDRIFSILQNSGVDADTIATLNEEFQRELQYTVLFPAMPLGDAVEYARFLIELSIARFRFVAGAEVCGGAVHIATISRKSGFEKLQ